MKMHSLAAAALITISGAAVADTYDLGTLDASGSSFSREFFRVFGLGSSAGAFVDYYTFDLVAPATGAMGNTTIDYEWGWGTNLTLASATLYRAGQAGALGADSTPSSFSFNNLGAGSYKLAISGDFQPGLLSSGGAQYTVKMSSIASAAPEAGSFAMAALGLAAVGAMVSRRRKS